MDEKNYVSPPMVWGVLIFFAGLSILFFSTYWYEVKNEADGEKGGEMIKEDEKNTSEELPNQTRPDSIDSITNTIAPDSLKKNLPMIRYDNKGVFLPSEVIMKQGEYGVECFLNIVNESDHVLLLRLGPYDAGKEKGFPYEPILPRESGTIDPRYGGIPDPIFYNAAHPNETVRVHVDQSCT